MRSIILDIRDRLEIGRIDSFVQGRFLEEGRYCRLFKNGMESTRAEREREREKERKRERERLTMMEIVWMSTEEHFEKPSGYRSESDCLLGQSCTCTCSSSGCKHRL